MKTDNLTITNEDNMELMARYPDNYFDLAIVDPPYGIGEADAKNHSRGKTVKARKYTIKNWDSKVEKKSYFTELKRVSKNQVIWGANHFIENIPSANSSSWVVWNKVNGNTDFADCELAYTSFKRAVRMFNYMWNGMLQGSHFNGLKREGNIKKLEKRIHPTQKPVQLYKWLLMNYAKEGDKILDTHLGSGSIAIAAHNLGFELTACELDKDYFDASIKRINNHINQKRLF